MHITDWTGRVALAIAAACVTLVVVTIGVLAIPAARARLGLAPARTASYAVGGRIDVPPAVYESSPYTLVLFARSTCSACQHSAPLFAQMTADLAEHPAIRTVLMTTAETRPGDLGYAKSIGLTEAQVITINPGQLRLKVVPTLVLVDRQGQVRYSHEGAASPGDVDDVLRVAASLREMH